NYPKISFPTNEAGPGEDAPLILGKLTDAFPALTPLIVNKTLSTGYKEINNAWGTHGEVFNTSIARGKVLSCAIGVSVENTNQVMDIATRLNQQFSFVGIFTC